LKIFGYKIEVSQVNMRGCGREYPPPLDGPDYFSGMDLTPLSLFSWAKDSKSHGCKIILMA